jgi:hypothetical protein
MYVTNLTQSEVTATAQFAVVDRRGVQIGSMSKSAADLQPNGFIRIEVVSPNASAVEFKLMKLSGSAK